MCGRLSQRELLSLGKTEVSHLKGQVFKQGIKFLVGSLIGYGKSHILALNRVVVFESELHIDPYPIFRVVYKSWQSAKLAGFFARFCQLLSLPHQSRYVEEMMFIRSHNHQLFTKLRLLMVIFLGVSLPPMGQTPVLLSRVSYSTPLWVT